MSHFDHPISQDTDIRHNLKKETGTGQNNQAWPLTAGQQSLWLMQKMHPEDVTYNTGFAIHIPFSLDPVVIRKAMRSMCSWYPLFTAIFRMGTTEPECVTGKTMPSLEMVDASGWEDETLQSKILEKQLLPFDLENGPVARMYIFSKNSAEHIILFVVHHIIYDFECKALIYEAFMRHCQEVYQGMSLTGELPTPKPFREHVIAERDLLAGEMGKKYREFWQQQAGEFPVMRELAAYRQLQDGEMDTTAASTFKVDITLYQQLKEQTGRQNVTTFAWLQSVFQLLVHKYTGLQKIVTGVPVSNRDHRLFKDTLGYFVNLLPVTSTWYPRHTFTEHLRDSTKNFIRILSHKQYPFSDILALADIDRAPGKHPLLQHVLNYLVFPKASGGAKADQYGNTYYDLPQQSPFSIALDVVDDGEQLHIQCKYRTAAYDDAFIEDLCQQYLWYLQQSIAKPDVPLDEWQWTRPAWEQQLEEWNSGVIDHKDNEVIHRLFATVAALYAGQDAVVAPDTSITYGDLDTYANQLAHFIRVSYPASKGQVMAYMLKRSTRVVVSILGILKAGAAYMPVDPDLPPARIKAMLQATGCEVLVCDDIAQLALLELPAYIRIIAFNSDEEHIRRMQQEEPDCLVTGEDTAYVMFTSGSTGHPKPVQVLHAGVVNLVKDNKCLPIGPGDNMAQLSNYIFDGSTFEIFGALLNGAGLHILPVSTVYSREALLAYVNEQKVNVALLPTSLFNRFATEDPAFVAAFDRLFFGGEAASLEYVRQVMPYCKHAGVLVNAYGPTECTVISLYYPVYELSAYNADIPLGRPLNNAKVYVLDEQHRSLPMGVAGELYISGKGVSGGYFKRPDLNESRFINAPWNDNERLYATGDIVCYLPYGQLQFVGRRDQQFKFRGYRIEPGEIETTISTFPGVSAVWIHKHQPATGPAVLIAFVETTISEITAVVLTTFLSDKLPHYMIPGKYILLNTFPLNRQGKVDHHVLLQHIQQVGEQEYTPPQTSEEKTVAAIWERAMHLERISIHDNFFAIGGHSLLAARIMAEITAYFDVEVSLGAVFRSPTIHTISNEIIRRKASTAGITPEIKRADRGKFIRH
ncbi:non-ribosomal peptide synthetase [Chitinophaga pendula]|uniref:non-ribosomal peptide synthetase n=1 Tax=Chitinophaga TaxID=79328 RepID=UPI000BAF7868|nr:MULTISPECIES: non-ribosomal peptide synthetase [Chitinophaga]ASZ14096.1 hypothetical protein CK934_25670 [Chitinophaga sp. MD30]UCJ08272.1 non-ribosomal peptide synthetase [Chitinophaga pendula]